MTDLIICDGYVGKFSQEFSQELYDRLLERTTKFTKAIKSLPLPDSFLLRQIQDLGNNDNFSSNGGINRLLWNCIINGSDRIDPERWEDVSDLLLQLKKKGLKANDIIFAELAFKKLSRYSFYSYGDDYCGPPMGANICTLVIDKRYYDRFRVDFLYSQPDIEKRRKALEGIVLFDNGFSPLYPRPDLRFKLDEETFQKVMREIGEAGYFVD